MKLTSSKSSALKGKVNVPGDKSISHRALIISSQAIGTSKITGMLEGEDVIATANALRAMGVGIEKNGDTWLVKGVGVGGLSEPDNFIDMENTGTGCRLLMGLVCTQGINVFLTGDASLRKRPMDRVTIPLTQMGARFVTREKGRLPLVVQGTRDAMPIVYEMPVASAQVKSAVLLAALNTPGTTGIIEKEPTRDHTEKMLKAFGAEISRSKNNVIMLKGQPELTAQKIVVPGDPSSAAFLVVAALIVPNSQITIQNICINPHRTGLFTTLKEMGADIKFKNKRIEGGEEVADLEVKTSKLKGVKVPAERAPSMIDEYPVLAVAASFASGKTVMQGLKELRVKESDRLKTIYDGLIANGVKAKMGEDSLEVTGGKVSGGGLVKTHIDHRIAMSFLVMGLAAEKTIAVDDGSPIATSFPNFVELMYDLGAKIKSQKPRPLVIAVDGPAASGKGTLSRRIAEKLGVPFLDTGAIYRAVGLKLVYNNKDANNKKHAIEAAKSITPNDLTNPRIRQERVGQAASIISAYPEVRQILLDFQRDFAKNERGAVLDGRDIGTVVCPDADLKLFVTANMETRASRRYREIIGEGFEVSYESVLEDLKERDERDSKRKTAPLKPAKEAVLVDTTDMTADEVFVKVWDEVEKLR
jgi:3-phosphoshikimate 1-carboxyvinyltransferase